VLRLALLAAVQHVAGVEGAGGDLQTCPLPEPPVMVLVLATPIKVMEFVPLMVMPTSTPAETHRCLEPPKPLVPILHRMTAGSPDARAARHLIRMSARRRADDTSSRRLISLPRYAAGRSDTLRSNRGRGTMRRRMRYRQPRRRAASEAPMTDSPARRSEPAVFSGEFGTAASAASDHRWSQAGVDVALPSNGTNSMT